MATAPKVASAVTIVPKPKTGIMAMPKEKQAMLGLGGAAGVLMFIGAPILLPIAAAGGAGYLYWKGHRQTAKMTPERQKIYEAALRDLKDGDKLRTLADSFQAEGLIKEAAMLRKRATLRELPPEQRKVRKTIFKEGLKSTNPHGVEELAAAFEGEGATGAAEALRIHAAALRSL